VCWDHHFHGRFISLLAPQSVHILVRTPGGTVEEAQHSGGCLVVFEHDADDEPLDERALVVSPTASPGVGELVLLYRAACGRVSLLAAMLTSHRCRIGLVEVRALLVWRPARFFASSTTLSHHRSEPSVVRVLLHDESELGDSLCLNASRWPRHHVAGLSEARAAASSAARIKMWRHV
jgi:hypothetical protein